MRTRPTFRARTKRSRKVFMVLNVSSRDSRCASSHRYRASSSFFSSMAWNTSSSAREASMLAWGREGAVMAQGEPHRRYHRPSKGHGPGVALGAGRGPAAGGGWPLLVSGVV